MARNTLLGLSFREVDEVSQNDDMAGRPTAEGRVRTIRTAALIALVGNALLAIAKVSIGILFRSLAVVGDGIDSSTDVIIAVMSLFVAGVIARPADNEHPWGHARAETMATTVLAFILFFAGGQLILSAIDSLSSGAKAALPETPALIVTLVSIVGKAFLALTQFALGKKAGSPMLMANGTNMRNDVIISSGVLAGLCVAVFAKVPAADSVTAILVGLWVLKSSISIFMDVNLELMDGIDEKSPYKLVFDAVHSVKGAGRPHRARMRKIASKWDIDLDIEVDGKMNVSQAHSVAEQVEAAIKERVVDVYDIMVHVEPEGYHERAGSHEAFGLSESVLEKQAEGKGKDR
jgi:cation diffusion facilitator family transporter